MTGIKDPLNIADDDRRHPVLGKHKAFELVRQVESCLERGYQPVAFEALALEVARHGCAQHALIVQMQETIEACHSALVRIREAGGKSTSAETHDALAAADQYLGEQA